jgi:hypothetical protein
VDVLPEVKEGVSQFGTPNGVTSLHGLAAALNERGIPTASGAGQWQATSVSRLLARLSGD